MNGPHGFCGVGRQRGGMPPLAIVFSVVRDGGARADDAITLGGFPLVGPGCKCVVPERVGCQAPRDKIENTSYYQNERGAAGDEPDNDLRWTTSDFGGRGVLQGPHLFERLQAGQRPDARDRFAVGPQPILIPPCGDGPGHTAEICINTHTESRVPADDGDAISLSHKSRGAPICKHTVGAGERYPRSYNP